MLGNFEALDNIRLQLENLLLVCNTLDTKSGIQRLKTRIKSELSFLKRLSKNPADIKDTHLRSSNLPYLSAVVSCVEASHNVDEIMKPICIVAPNGQEFHTTIDVVSDYGKTWIKVVARNPHAIVQSSLGAGGFGRRSLIEQMHDLKECAALCPYLYQPPAIKVWFAAGVEPKMKQLLEEMDIGAMGDVLESSFDDCEEHNSDDSFDQTDVTKVDLYVKPKCIQRPYSTVSEDSACRAPNEGEHRNFSKNVTVLTLEEIPGDAVLNLDVSTLIAQISALTNGGCHYVYQENILTEQAQQERNAPIRPQLDTLFQGRTLVCCETAYRDFQEILRTVGGPEEKRRAKEFLLKVTVVPDQPSPKAMALLLGGRVKSRSRIVFGTGDTLQAVTVTANKGFLRAAEAQGIQLVSHLHESRALTEAKEETAQHISTTT